MFIGAAHIIGKSPYSYRAGAMAKIIGVKWVQPEPTLEVRPCFEVEYDDGVIDFIPISELDTKNLEICMRSR